MCGGSLHRQLADLVGFGGDLIELDPGEVAAEKVQAAILLRVDHYLSVFESIRSEGWDESRRPMVSCSEDDGLYYLNNGHHRISALRVLAIDTVRVEIRRVVGAA